MATVGNLVVNLLGNTRPLQSSLGRSNSMIKSFAGGVSRLLAPAAAAFAGVFGVKASLDAAREQIRSEKKLASVLESTGHAAGLSAQQIMDYASHLQDLTNFGDEATISNAGVLATFKNIKGDVFKDILARAQDMASVFENTTFDSAIVMLGKAFNDPIQGMNALRRTGVSFTEEQKEQIKTLQKSGDLLGAQKVLMAELNSEVGGAAKKMRDPITQLKNLLGDVAENIGFLLLPSINAIADSLHSVIGPTLGNADVFKQLGQIAGEWTQKLIGGTQHFWGVIQPIVQSTRRLWESYFNYVLSAWDAWTGAIDAVWSTFSGGQSIVDSFMQSQTGMLDLLTAWVDKGAWAFQNWDTLLMIGAEQAKLFASNTAERFRTMFVNVGEMLGWFKDNWKDVVKDIANLYITSLKNMLENTSKFFKAAVRFAEGKGFKFEPKGLFAGFESSIKQLPKLTKAEIRKTTPELERLFNELKPLQKRGFGLDEKSVEGPKLPKGPGENDESGGAFSSKPIAALEEGSSAAFSAIQRVLREGRNKKAEQAQDAEIRSEQTLKNIEQTQRQMVDVIKGNTFGVVEI